MIELRRLIEHAGSNEMSYHDPEFPERALTLYSARPRHFTQSTPVLFSHHGRGRNGRDYRDYFLAAADAHDIFVIAPEFSDEAFPGQAWYNNGNMRDERGRAKPREQCTYGIVERLFETLRTSGITTTNRYGLFGHSAGSQFVHHMVSFGFRSKVAAAVAANAGTYAMPDLAIDFPHGLGGTGFTVDALRALLAFPLTVMAGTADNNPLEKFFPKDAGSMRQGGTRHERAHRYVRMGHDTAARLGVRCAWTITDVQDVAHDGARMAAAAAPVLAAALHFLVDRHRQMVPIRR
jgi:hypothetical protein